VVGPQQNYMKDYEAKMFRDGDALYKRRQGGERRNSLEGDLSAGGGGGASHSQQSLLLRSHSPVGVPAPGGEGGAAQQPLSSPPRSPEKDALELRNLEKMKKPRVVSTSPVKNRAGRPPAGDRMPAVGRALAGETAGAAAAGGTATYRSTSSRKIGGGGDKGGGGRPRSVGGRRY
jgi:hypothetical protein